MVKEQGKKAGGPWDCYNANNFYGWEAERVVAVTGGNSFMELITRARTHLSVILVDDSSSYAATKEYFQQAADLGLIEMVQMGEKDVDISPGDAASINDTLHQFDHQPMRCSSSMFDGFEMKDKNLEDAEQKMEDKISCMSGCCTS